MARAQQTCNLKEDTRRQSTISWQCYQCHTSSCLAHAIGHVNWSCPKHWTAASLLKSSRYPPQKMLGFVLFLGTLDMVARFMIQLGDFAATNCFPSGFASSENNCARREYFEIAPDVFENLFFDFTTCTWICLSICAMCVSMG